MNQEVCYNATNCAFTGCDDQNNCTVDTCNGIRGCSYTSKICATGELCDPMDGNCKKLTKPILENIQRTVMPYQKCQGHCLSNIDCSGDLICNVRSINNLEINVGIFNETNINTPVPGCMGLTYNTTKNINYCYDKNDEVNDKDTLDDEICLTQGMNIYS